MGDKLKVSDVHEVDTFYTKYFVFPVYYEVAKLIGFVYGPLSCTFQYHRKRVRGLAKCLEMPEID